MKSPPVEQLKMSLGMKKHKPPKGKSHFKRYNQDLLCPRAAGCKDIDHCGHSKAHGWDSDCDYACKGPGQVAGACVSLTKVVLDTLHDHT